MKNRPFALGAALLLLNLGVDAMMIANGLVIFGVLSCIGTILVFASAMVWLIYQDDRALHFRRGWLAVPLVVFGVALAKMFEESGIAIIDTPENIQEIGSLLMSRYQLGLWIVSSVLLFMFVLAASLMTRRRA